MANLQGRTLQEDFRYKLGLQGPSLKDGFSAVEVLLGSVILGMLVVAMVGAILFGEEGTALSGARNRASLLADEGLEASRNIRDAAFTNLTNGSFGLTTTGNIWNFSGSSDTTDIFTRVETTVTATSSADAKDITSTITWQQNLQRTGNISLNSRLTNWHRTFGNWSSPSQQSSVNLAGNGQGNKIDLQGIYAYMVRTGTPNFAIIDISNPASPSLVGSLTLSGIPLNIFVSGSYAYVSSSDNASELQIIDISTPASPVQVGTFNAPGNADGEGVCVVGTTVFLTRFTNADNFVIINAGTPSAPTQTAIMSLAGPTYECMVLGTHVFISTGDNASELRVVDVSNLSSPSLVGSLGLAGNADAVTITGYQSPDTVFMGQDDGTVSIVNVATPTAPSLISNIAAGTSANDLSLGVASGYLFMATANGAADFQVFDISSLATPTLLGIVNLTNNLNGIVYDPIRDRAYVVGTDNSNEFIVIRPL